MQIDWFTLVAQLINFVVLLALLRLVLYDRVLNVMRQRETEVSERLESIEQKEQEAREHEEAALRERDELERNREALIRSVREEVDTHRTQMMRELREEVQRTRENWKESLQQEQDGIVHDIQEHLADLVATAVERALFDLADRRLEDQMIESFFRRLADAEDPDWAELRKALRANPDDVAITSAHELCKDRERRLNSQLAEAIGEEINASFEVKPSLVAGVELEVAGRTFGWNIDDYVARLREEFVVAIQAELDPGRNHGCEPR